MERLLLRFSAANPEQGTEDSDMSTAQNNINSAEGTGSSAINSYDPTAAGNTSTGDVTANFGTAQGQNAQAVNPLQSVINSNPTVTNLYQQGNALYNVPTLASRATNLSNEVTNEDPNNYQAAKGFDIDNADIQNGIANQNAYLLPQSNAATANANTASGLASNYVQAGIQQNQMNLIPAQENATLTAQNQAAEETGWNQAQQQTLEGLMQKMESGVQLSSAEMQTAQSLASTEEAYNSAVNANTTALKQSQIGQEYQTLTPAQTLYNTITNSTYRAA